MKTMQAVPNLPGASSAELPQSVNPVPQRSNATVAAGANTARCTHCNKNVSCHYNTINHKKQLLLSILTIGLWLPMWLGMMLCPTKLCDECGGPIWND
ncbi:MAG: hypothetical protein GX621_09455 [Pirellulaceae bacterium]|nr:hypothetical protein [Pirellulaceae bacterium]